MYTMNNYNQDNKSKSGSLGKFMKKKLKHSNNYCNEEDDSDCYCYNNSTNSPSPAKTFQGVHHLQHPHPIYQYPYEQKSQQPQQGANLIGLSSGSHTSDSNATLTDSELVLMNNSANSCIIEKKILTVPPDVPPRNNMGTVNRLNGRMQNHPVFSNEILTKTTDYIENTTCLERTPSGNVYIPAGTLGLAPNFNKNHYQHHSNNSLCSSPTKDKNLPYGTPIPVRTTTSNNTMGTLRLTDHHHHHHHHNHLPPHYSSSTSSSAIPSRFSFRKNVQDNCSWKCTALLSILLSVITIVIISYNLTSAMYEGTKVCPVFVNDNVENLPAVAENTFVTVPVLSTRSNNQRSDSVTGNVKHLRQRRDLFLHDNEVLVTNNLHDLSYSGLSSDFTNYEVSTNEQFSSTSNSINSISDIISSNSIDTSTSYTYEDITVSTTEMSTIFIPQITEKLHKPQNYLYEIDQPKRQQRIFLNISMEAKDLELTDDSNNIIVAQNQPMYLLSLSLPIINNNDVVIVPKLPEQKQKQQQDTYNLVNKTETTTSKNDWGAGCQCFCPCMDNDDDWVSGDGEDNKISTTMTSVTNSISNTDGCGLISGQSFPPEGMSIEQIGFDQKLAKSIRPFSFWNLQFFQDDSAYVRFDFTVMRGAKLGFYARRNALPTHTQYDIFDTLNGFKVKNSRITVTSFKKQAIHYMEKGNWFMSLYNDDIEEQQIELMFSIADELTQQCPNGCSGKGECLMGQCQCNPGFGGNDCNDSICPVLCNNRGTYVNGECLCNTGWKGKNCQLRLDECEIADCNGHGHCVNGKCICAVGYKGIFCSEVDCLKPNCSGHGICIESVCHCKKGWKGSDCSETDKEALECLPNCSGHGTFDLDSQKCICHLKWSGDDCSRELCNLNCGLHGQCINNGCECFPTWSGEYCNVRKCDERCKEHGQCRNGTCVCATGWNGKYCSIEGCPSGCSGHGECQLNFSEHLWQCQCDSGWKGADCNSTLEQYCDDGIDDDRDGLIDCEDPECCQSVNCKSSQLCITAPKPIDVLLSKNPPTVTASFFERMKFLIDEDSLQSYAKSEVFNESRSAVIRGQVITSLGLGLMGVRVSTKNKFEGFTFTRDDGWFDLLVNGGGSVTLVFGRIPFGSKSYVVSVPWNEIVVVDKIVLVTKDEKHTHNNESPLRYPLLSAFACYSHDYANMKPIIVATWKHGFHGSRSDVSGILAESQVVQETFKIPGTNLNLVYHSSRAAGYLSTIQLQLTPDIIPNSLQKVYLKITIEGILFEKIFEADPLIKFTYAWNRRNVYRQRVYGMTTATVKVGYEYLNCKKIIWTIQTTQLSGHDMSISEVGGWNLDIHHRYNFHEGILQKGDGSNIYFKEKPKNILTTMGDGHQRNLQCDKNCNGIATKQRLLAPVALASSADGSLYVGDFNLIRKISKDGNVRTLVKLNTSRISYRYHLAVSPKDGALYISDPEMHQIIRVIDVNNFNSPETNYETVIGNGERCLPGDEAHCGDGSSATDAKLAYPKGIAISFDNIMYFADGTNIRMVNLETNIITTLIGDHMHKSHWKPLPCEGIMKLEEAHLRWPTELTVNPLDNSLHIIDDHMILKVTVDGRLQIIAGRPLHCNYLKEGNADVSSSSNNIFATKTTLIMPQSFAFDSYGALYIAESDSQRINRIRKIDTDGSIELFAGLSESKCNCLEKGCDCFGAGHFIALNSKLNTISAVTVTPDGIVHISDQANYRIRSVISNKPEFNLENREFEIYASESQEVYIFNRFGQHVVTRNLITGKDVYMFTYNVNTSNGKLNSITDSAGNIVFLLRDYSNQVNLIDNTRGQKCRISMSRSKLLQQITTPDNFNITIEYLLSTGLIKSKRDSNGRSYLYEYDNFGRLIGAVTPTGKTIRLSFDLNVRGASVVNINDNTGKKPTEIIIKSGIMGSTPTVWRKIGTHIESKTTTLSDLSITTVSGVSKVVHTEMVPYTLPVAGDSSKAILGESYPVPGRQIVEIGGDVMNRFEWRYFLKKQYPQFSINKPKMSKFSTSTYGSTGIVSRKMRINGEDVLNFEYDRIHNLLIVSLMESSKNGNNDSVIERILFNVTFDDKSRLIKWISTDNIYEGVQIEYHDRYGRLSKWQRGDEIEGFEYDQNGKRLSRVHFGDDSTLTYTYKDTFTNQPLKVTMPRGSDYMLKYDDSGALSSITTPRGHIHFFNLQISFGFYKYQYYSPSNRHPYEIIFNEDGQILSKTYPHQSGRIVHIYNDYGKLETTLSGLKSIHFNYYDKLGLIKSIDVVEPSFEQKQEFKYYHNSGLLKDQQHKFSSKHGLSNVHYKYLYDNNGRLAAIDSEISNYKVPGSTIKFKYNINLNLLEQIGDLKIGWNRFNRTVLMQDNARQFVAFIQYDSYSRPNSIRFTLKSYDVFRQEFLYDKRNRIIEQKTVIGRTESDQTFTYDKDGNLFEASTSDSGFNYKYVYDENGNVINVIYNADNINEKVTIGYDIGDRVSQYNSEGLDQKYSYDNRGFVISRGDQKYRYNAEGLMTHAVEENKFQAWYYYDHLNRLVSWHDDKGNVTQFLYSNPLHKNQVTHLYYPKEHRLLKFFYDKNNNLIMIETSDQKFYVACDQNGTPLAAFDTNGNVVKIIKRTPFGHKLIDSNAQFFIPIDFYGGIYDPNTKLIFINNRFYDPLVGQWMSADWTDLFITKLYFPTELFFYRFHNNDPINGYRLSKKHSYILESDEWLQLFGFRKESIIGSLYTDQFLEMNQIHNIEPVLKSDFKVLSGLQCIVERVNSNFLETGLFTKWLSSLKPELLNLVPRVAYRKSVFGNGVLLSRTENSKVLINVLNNDGIIEDVISSVFNNTHFLDLYFNIHNQNTFYFIKKNALKLRDDLDELKRLSGIFNITTHESNLGESSKEIRLHGPDSMIVLKYDVDPEQEKHRILKHALKRAIERAWDLEKQAIAAGFQGRTDWREDEKEELISHGYVDGFEGVDIHNIFRYPQLADDPSNIGFRRDAKRKRRRI